MRKNQIGKDILNALIIGGAIILALSSPISARRFWRQLPKELRKYKRRQLLNACYRLKSDNRVKYVKQENSDAIVEITDKGKKYFHRLNLDDLSIKRQNPWDKRWRLVIFDIPEKKKITRETIREKLKDLKMIRLQDSVWITPFPCQTEIDFIKNVFNVKDSWVSVITTSSLDALEYKFRSYFDLI